MQTWNDQSYRYEPRMKESVCVVKASQGTNIQCSYVCNDGYECDKGGGCKRKSYSCTGEPWSGY